jgi:hypothetical protein
MEFIWCSDGAGHQVFMDELAYGGKMASSLNIILSTRRTAVVKFTEAQTIMIRAIAQEGILFENFSARSVTKNWVR